MIALPGTQIFKNFSAYSYCKQLPTVEVKYVIILFIYLYLVYPVAQEHN